ncbi:MAG: PKD domain-containing protein [Candidatus Thermoplasmatota archaeon]|nr:PKD domain-containing protein [Candidatus Thermoplasmatota archaeon]
MMNRKSKFILLNIAVTLILALSMVLLPTQILAAEENEYYVDSGYRGYSDGTAQQPYSSIQIAIDEADEGDTIYVFGGLYEEIIIVDKQVNLWGGVEGTDSIINADEDVRYTMKITADNVEIQDFIFTDQNKVKTSPIGALISVQAENVVITSNQFNETDSFGIHIDQTADGTVVNGNVINNTEKGVVVESSDTNDIFNNEIFACMDAGIFLDNAAENRLYDNTIYSCSKAIHGSFCSKLNLSNNTLYENTYASILIESCSQTTIRHNHVYDNTGTGLFLQSDYCTVKRNDFESNQRGITLSGNYNEIYKNQFLSHTGSGIFALTTSKQSTIYNNTFEENGKNADDAGNNDWYMDETGNYWDDYNWIDLDKDGIGDKNYIQNGVVDEYPLGFFLHPPDKPSKPVPSDTKAGVGLRINLKAKIVDEDSDSLDVTFYNADTDEVIGIDKKVTSGKYASCDLTLPFNTTYAWYVYVTDGIQENISDTFFFTTMVTPPDNEPPVADGGGPYSADAAETISFDASASYDNDGEIDFYRWNFGDGTSELLAKQPMHTYQDDGIYTVTLTVIDNLGSTDTQTFSVPVGVEANQRPTADPGGPYQGMVDENIVFDGSQSKDSDGNLEEYIWDFGDDTTGSGATITHSYSEAGSYLVTLTVTDNYGDSHAESTTVSIESPEEPEETPGFTLMLLLVGIMSLLVVNIIRRR